ncbi:MAG: hypothetical protein K2X81_23285 [Candidatus Obscuribacterales bacterium]|nr:hypothetical protein [Candidatus Obscuribacterales bacterium]
MSLYEVAFDFSSPLRVPSHSRDGLRIPLSVGADRFFSFVALGWSRLFGTALLKEQLIDPLVAADYPFVFSDLFPDIDDDLLIPAVLHTGESSSLSRHFQAKWTPLRALLKALAADSNCPQLLAGEALTDAFQFNSVSRLSASSSSSLLLNSEHISVLSFENSRQLRATVPASNEIEGKEALLKLKGLLEIKDESLLEPLKAVLAFMKEEGLGGMRSSGAGQINSLTISPAVDFSFQSKLDKVSKFLILSPASPTQEMIRAIQSSPAASNRYSISKAGGWIYDENGHHTGLKKNVTRFFETGSVFSVLPQGRLLDLSRDGNLCYRYGIPFVVQI